MTRQARRPRALLLLSAMATSFAGYVVWHSPLRDVVAMAALGRASRTPYFAALQELGYEAALNAAAAAGLIACACLVGLWLADRLAVGMEWPLVAGLGAFAALVVPAAAIGAFASATGTTLLRPPAGFLLAAAMPALVVATRYWRGWRPRVPRPTWPRGPAGIVTAIAGTLLAVSAGFAVLQPPTGFDALAYHGPLAVYFWRDGNLTAFLDRSPYGFALAMPGNAELWFGVLLAAGGERLANLGQLPFALLGASAVFVIARRVGCRPAGAALGAAAFLLAPIVVLQAGVQVNDLAAAALVMTAAALASVAPRDWTAGRAGLVGLALALAAATKLAALPAVAAIGLFSIVQIVRRSGWPMSGSLVHPLAVLALSFMVAVSPWWGRNLARFGNPIYPSAIPFVGRGVVVGDFEQKDDRFVPSRAAWPVYPLVEPLNEQSGLGPLFLVGAIPGVLIAATRRRRTPLVLLGLLAAFMLPPWWLLTQHEPRFLLALFGLAFAFLPGGMALLARRDRRIALMLLIVVSGFSAAVTFDQGLLPRLSQPGDRAAFYDTAWNVDPAVAGLPDSEPLLYNTGYASLSYAGDYALLGRSRQRLLFTVDADISTGQILDLMRRSGVRYAYVPASPGVRADVEAKYAAPHFQLERVSIVSEGERAGTSRYLFRMNTATALLSNGDAALTRAPRGGSAP